MAVVALACSGMTNMVSLSDNTPRVHEECAVGSSCPQFSSVQGQDGASPQRELPVLLIAGVLSALLV